MKEIIINKNEANLRFDKYLKKVLSNAPNSFIYKMLRKKNIVLNGKKADGTEKTKEGDVVKFFLSDDTFEKMSSSYTDSHIDYFNLDYSRQIDVLYEDEDVCYLNKPAGLLTQSDESKEFCLNDYFLAYLFQNKKITEKEYKTFHPSISNRLDRNTSGIVLCGKSLKGLQDNAQMLKERTLEKHYYALVKGKVENEGLVLAYLSKDEASNKVQIVNEAKEGYQLIKTEYKIVEKLGECTLLDIHLITGRTHQIRAHLASLNHPIIGDYKYGDKNINDRYKKAINIKYQLLHSAKMIKDSFIVEAPLPDYFLKALEYAKEN